MPIYCYSCEACGRTTEHSFGMHDAHPETMRCECGGTAERDFRAEQGHMKNTAWEPCNWIHSQGMAVHPSQVAEARAFNKRHGVPTTDYDPTGAPIFTSPGQMKAYGKAWGAGKMNAACSEPSPVNSREQVPEYEYETGGVGVKLEG